MTVKTFACSHIIYVIRMKHKCTGIISTMTATTIEQLVVDWLEAFLSEAFIQGY